MPDDIFNNETPPNPNQGDDGTPPVDAFATQLASIVNTEGQPKYDSVTKALDAIAPAQAHITNLEGQVVTKDAELVSLREQVAKNDGVEEVIARLTANQTPDHVVQETPQPNVGVDEKAVLDLVQGVISANATQVQSEANVSSVNATLVAKYGEKASEIMEAKAKELGTTVEGMKTLSAQNPALVLALFPGATPVSNPSTSTSITLDSTPPGNVQLEKPAKSLLSGATSKEQKEFMAKIQADVYAKHNVET